MLVQLDIVGRRNTCQFIIAREFGCGSSQATAWVTSLATWTMAFPLGNAIQTHSIHSGIALWSDPKLESIHARSVGWPRATSTSLIRQIVGGTRPPKTRFCEWAVGGLRMQSIALHQCAQFAGRVYRLGPECIKNIAATSFMSVHLVEYWMVAGRHSRRQVF